MSKEPIYCFIALTECRYKECVAFNSTFDECGFTTMVTVVNSILGGPVRAQPLEPREQEVLDTPPISTDIGTFGVAQALANANIDASLLEMKGEEIKPKKWLDDLWNDIDAVLKEQGYRWKTDGKNSRWIRSDEVPVSPPRKPKQRSMQPPVDLSKMKPFPTLTPGNYLQGITGTVVTNPETREVDTRRGSTVITNFMLSDGITEIRAAMWGELEKAVSKFKVGDVVTLTGMSVKDPYRGTPQISSTSKTTVS